MRKNKRHMAKHSSKPKKPNIFHLSDECINFFPEQNLFQIVERDLFFAVHPGEKADEVTAAYRLTQHPVEVQLILKQFDVLLVVIEKIVDEKSDVDAFVLSPQCVRRNDGAGTFFADDPAVFFQDRHRISQRGAGNAE